MKKQKVKEVKKYLNPVSQLHLQSQAPYSVLIAARGFSKSFTNGIDQAIKVKLMPRSVGLFTSPTYAMIYSKTVIPMKAALEQHFGYIEDIHYVIGRTPPKNFKRPWHKPSKYDNVITFWNGRTIVFGSFDRPSLISGGSYDDVVNDEAYLIEKEDYDNYVIPSLRGTHSSFRDTSIHLQHRFTSSMPFRGNGEWLLDYYAKAKSNPQMYSFIGWEPNEKFQLGNIWMNVDHLGDKAIQQMEVEMKINERRVMLYNQKVTNWGNLFYPLLSKKHWYTPRASDIVIVKSLNLKAAVRDASWDEGPDDYNPDKPLNISHDWGVFNCITIDQEYQKEVRFINAMHVHNPKILTDLADEFAEYYRMHRCRVVYQYGDRAGTNKQANAKRNYFDQFADRLRDKGWRVVRKTTGHVEHLDRHLFINKLHAEEDPRLPVIRYNSKMSDFRIALESAGMKDSKKDKSSETNPSIKPEHSTHYTDAHDYRLYHGLKNRESSSDSLSSSSNL